MKELKIGKLSLSLAWGTQDDFSDEIDHQSVINDLKNDYVEKLNKWITEVTDRIQAYMIENQEEIDAGIAREYEFLNSTGIDIEMLTRDDLKSIQPSLKALHDLCQSKDIAIYLDGFDNLPRAHADYASIFNGKCHSFTNPELKVVNPKPAVQAFVRFDQPYNYHVNPYSEEQVCRLYEEYDLTPPE